MEPTPEEESASENSANEDPQLMNEGDDTDEDDADSQDDGATKEGLHSLMVASQRLGHLDPKSGHFNSNDSRRKASANQFLPTAQSSGPPVATPSRSAHVASPPVLPLGGDRSRQPSAKRVPGRAPVPAPPATSGGQADSGSDSLSSVGTRLRVRLLWWPPPQMVFPPLCLRLPTARWLPHSRCSRCLQHWRPRREAARRPPRSLSLPQKGSER